MRVFNKFFNGWKKKDVIFLALILRRNIFIIANMNYSKRHIILNTFTYYILSKKVILSNVTTHSKLFFGKMLRAVSSFCRCHFQFRRPTSEIAYILRNAKSNVPQDKTAKTDNLLGFSTITISRLILLVHLWVYLHNTYRIHKQVHSCIPWIEKRMNTHANYGEEW